MKKVVLLAPYFLPRRRVGSWRPFKFAIHLREFGWQPHVITLQEPSGTLTQKEQDLLKGIPIYKLKPPFDFTQSLGSSIEDSKSPSNKSKEKSTVDSFLDFIDKNFPIDTWLPLFWFHKNKVARVISEIKPDVLWSTGDPWSSHWLAGKIAAKADIPWVADFRDPWTLGDVNLKNRSSFSKIWDKKAERKVIQNASVLMFTSRQTEALYQKHYGILKPRTETLYNCFDLKLYKEPEPQNGWVDENKLNLLFFGRFRRLSPAKSLIDILAYLKDQLAEDLPVVVHSFGPLSQQDRVYAAKKRVQDCFKDHDPIPAEQALSVLPQADILWLSTDPARKNIIPAKLWDYLAAGRPILSIAPNPEIEQILNRTGGGKQFHPNDIQQVAELLNKCIVAKQQGKPLPIAVNYDQGAIQAFEATELTRLLASILDDLA